MSPRALRMNTGNIDDAAVRTPCRSTAGNHTEAIASVVSISSATRSTTINRKGNGISNKEAASEGEGFKTPAPKSGACAICLSPLGKRDVYTVQLCRVRRLQELSTD